MTTAKCIAGRHIYSAWKRVNTLLHGLMWWRYCKWEDCDWHEHRKTKPGSRRTEIKREAK